MEIMRRWKAVIEDIEITNDSDEVFSPFVQFIVGGDFYVSGSMDKYGDHHLLFIAG